jgi:acyl-CoA thioesterase-1
VEIVCLGDSITWGFPFGPQDSWVAMLQKELQVEIINRGINGNTTSDMLHRFDRHVLQVGPTHLILMGGINDVVGQESYEVIVRNLQMMIDKALAAGIIVILGTPTAVDYAPWERSLMRLRDWIHQTADQLQLKVIDFHQAFYDSQGQLLTELLLPDGGHPARSGYQAMFEQIDLSIFASSD